MNMKQKNPKTSALIRLCAFTLVFILVLFALESLFFSDQNIHPTWTYVSDPEHEPIDILFVGNSHTYTTIDAEYISKSTGLNVRALTCPSINGEIVFTVIEAFLNYEVPKVIVLDMCPFTANNFDVMRNDKLGIVLQHFDGIPDYLPRLKAIRQATSLENVPSGAFQLLRNTLMWSRWKRLPHDDSYDAYGSSKKYKVFFARSLDPAAIRQSFQSFSLPDSNYRIHERNRIALHKILALAEEKGIDVWIYNSPIAVYAENYAATMAYIDSILESEPSIRYVDNAMLHLDDIGISKIDYYDSGHLNPNGMYKTSVWMAKLIGERYQLILDPAPQGLYQDSSVAMLGDNSYRYSFSATGENLYRFVYKAGETEIDTGFSRQNYFEDDYLSQKDLNSVRVYVLPADFAGDETSAVVYRFLPYALEAYTAVITDGHTLEITNDSNFSEELTFGWCIIDKETEETYEYACSVSPTFSHTFTKKGSFDILAYTRQNDGMLRTTKLMTVAYDEDTCQLTVDWVSEFVTIK